MSMEDGLGCDLLRIVLEFGLYVTRGDFSTDGKWCYVVLWVVARPTSLKVDWESLKTSLVACCPSCMPAFYLNQISSSKSPPLYLLKVFSWDRKGCHKTPMRARANHSTVKSDDNPRWKGVRPLFRYRQRIAYGRASASVNGVRRKKMLHPLRVMITNRGPDTELLVANPVELSGKGRPRVVYDVTFALKTLGICIFS
ncbi:ACT domain-containing protein ACR9-like protein, partial [Tanacetum coccineum]